MMYNGTLSQYVDRQIFYFGSYSPLELSFLRQAGKILRQTRNHLTFVDVGANVGQHSLFMSPLSDIVVAFEPNDEVADRLARNIDLNRIKNINLVRTALGSQVGQGRLGSGLEKNSGSRSLVWSNDAGRDILVPVICGDEALRELGIARVDMLKIDVEGYEKNTLAGLRETLTKDRPVILFELVGSDLKGGFRSEHELRSSLYSEAELFTLGQSPSQLLLPFDWHAEEAVCLPKELLESFASMLARGTAR
jgi:FkbM family methyltransferase